jgi:hypothetical protein
MHKVLLAFLFFPLFLSAQNSADNSINELKDTLAVLAKNMQRGENDSVRNASANIFQSLVETILNDPNSFTADFDSVKNISVKTAPDNSFRLYTWTYPNNEGGKYYYYGYLQTYTKQEFKKVKGINQTRLISLFKLNDSTDAIEKPLSTKLKPEKWYGAVYYSILKNVKNNKSYYTLLGWHGKNQKLTQKIIDVLSLDNGKPIFGYPLFKSGKVYHHRILFEYSSQVSFTLHYDENRKLLVFDHLTKVSGLPGPDGTYNAFKFVDGHWELVEDVDVDAGFKAKPAPKPVPDKLLDEKEKEIKK